MNYQDLFDNEDFNKFIDRSRMGQATAERRKQSGKPWHSEAGIAKISATHAGKTVSPETRAKISKTCEATRLARLSVQAKQPKPPRKPYTLTEEGRQARLAKQSKSIQTPYGLFVSKIMFARFLVDNNLAVSIAMARKRMDKWLTTNPKEYYYV